MSRTRWIVIAVIATVFAVFYLLDLGQYLSLEAVRNQQEQIQRYVAGHFALTIALYALLYIFIAALNIPGAGIMTVAGGAIFGLVAGTVIVSFASSIGATVSFLLARFLLRDYVEQRFRGMLKRVNKGIEKDGAVYLFTLRLIPVIPFFGINMAMALTRLRTWTFYWVSQVGMIPVTIIYVNAGTQLSQIEKAEDILSPSLLGSLVLLAMFPAVAKRAVSAFNRWRKLRHFETPDYFDTNLVVIGAGSAGLVTAYVAAAAKARVTLIESERMGGDCLNTGCVPSKALIRSATIAHQMRHSERYGLKADNVETDFPAVMARVREVIKTIEPHDSVERYTALGVDCVSGRARIVSPYAVDVDGKTITTRGIVIATGGRPAVPPIPGLESTGYVTSDTIWSLDSLPASFLVLGGGPIGCELAQAFARLGSAVTLVEMAPRILAKEDEDVAAAVRAALEADGVLVLTGYKATRFEKTGDIKLAHCEADTENAQIEFDEVLVAVGRKANTADLGLDKIGVELDDDGTISVDEHLETYCPNVYACGDVAGPYQLTHAAGHQGWYCAMNALFGTFKKFDVDYSALPWAVFTDPEVAHVGINEQEAAEHHTEYELTKYGIDDLDRAIADGEARGFVKILTARGSDRLLGVTIVGPHAGELITEFTGAMRNRLGLRKVLNTIHIYPTLAEANRYAAGEWQKNHLPQRALAIATKYHGWRR